VVASNQRDEAAAGEADTATSAIDTRISSAIARPLLAVPRMVVETACTATPSFEWMIREAFESAATRSPSSHQLGLALVEVPSLLPIGGN
jgi:hypothetical protein